MNLEPRVTYANVVAQFCNNSSIATTVSNQTVALWRVVGPMP